MVYMAESKVNIRKMIQTTRESYQVPEGEEWQITVSELIANSLDSESTWIKIEARGDEYSKLFTISCEDDGKGMDRDNFEEYHNIYTITKSRKSGTIGFAGIGAKLTLDLCKNVVTETKSDQEKYYSSNWSLIKQEKKKDQNGNGVESILKCEQCGELINSDMPHYDILESDMPIEMGPHRGTYVKVVDIKTVNLDQKSIGEFIIGEYQYSMILKNVKIFLNEDELKPIVPVNDDNEFEIDRERKYRATGKFGFDNLEFLEHFNFVKDSYKQRISESYPEEVAGGIDIVVYGKRIIRENFNIDSKMKAVDSQYFYGYIECDRLIDIVGPSKDSFNLKSSLWKFFVSKVAMEIESWLKEIGKFDESFWKMESPGANKEVKKFIDVLQNKFPSLIGNLFGVHIFKPSKDKGPGDQDKGEEETVKVSDPKGDVFGNLVTQGVLVTGTYGGPGVSDGPSVPSGDEGPEKGVIPDDTGNIRISEKKYTPRTPKLNVYVKDEPTKHHAVNWDQTQNAFVINSDHPGYKYSKEKGMSANDLYIIRSIVDYLINENEEISANEEQRAETIYNLYSALLS